MTHINPRRFYPCDLCGKRPTGDDTLLVLTMTRSLCADCYRTALARHEEEQAALYASWKPLTLQQLADLCRKYPVKP